MANPESDRPRLNLSINEVRRQQDSKQDNSFRFAEPVQKESRSEGREVSREPKAPREIHFTIRPGKVIKFFLMVLLLAGVFFTGRWSVDGSDIFSFSSSAPTAAVVSEKTAKTEAPAADTTAVEEKKEEVPVEKPAVEASAGSASDVPETIITKYTKVALAVPSVKKEWFGDWGKIMQLSITVKNNEDGTVKPAYIIMNVEGYDDFDKKISLPVAAQTVKAGQKLEATVNVPSGFAYSAVTAGNLDTVHITTQLFDAKDVLITAFESDFNLQG
ncbi:hypothetical protein HY496_03450 [Candidatus Woesearchaeota archaeon]|nr:hypothetical protein [Candidatus Woesearchaeota archaeon]